MKHNFMDPQNAGDVVEAIKEYVDSHGGDGAQWISYQDYQALTEQEKMNGTSYFIYDWPDAGVIVKGKVFVGTRAEWNALSSSEKATYDKSLGGIVNLTDDSEGTAHTIGTGIDISSYDSSSNKYTCPYDGYIRLLINTGGKGFAVVGSYNMIGTNDTYTGSNGLLLGIYVRAGMTVYLNDASGSVNLSFFPIQ